MTTTWLPDIQQGHGPLYARIADQIEQAIGNGALPVGTKLPPQRNLAFDIGVTIGTIGRAYNIVRERGLVSGEVGRGTYVLDHPESRPPEQADPLTTSLAGTRPIVAPPGKLRFDSTAAPDIGQGDILARLLGDISREHHADIASYARNFPDHWFEAGAQWLASGRFRPAPECIVPTLGAHAAVIAVISAVTSPGDRIAFETLTYSQVSRSAGLIGRRITLMASDEFGLIPEDFERVCAQQHPKLAFLMPSAQNPTVAIMPFERRQAVAEIARKYGVWLVEDNLYGSMTGDPIPLLAELAPERTFLVGGLSKSVAAGVRGGWVACPPHFSQRIRIAHKMISGGLPFLLAELCARLVLSGAASSLRGRGVEEIGERVAMAREIFAGFEFNSHPKVPFLWLKLPEPWLSGTFKQAALQEGVLIDDEDEFKAGRADRVFHRIRIGFSSPAKRADVEAGFHILRRLLDSGRTGYDSFD
ncbi:DNA-binding transcriptional MocR family regulator [Sinorhizobium fredii]|jgi:DNA-binding transcriptional MocR family regulator|uniref:Putative HTH-type transcriptional regulator YdeF n=1 Tax=Sinorhizobium fredii (strain USDA 257) TaxID=1185652 RepID=I3X9N7_SINF2|nr:MULTISPECIES: PLP-dependent aminotransferase family protein [Sinorhizobium]AFL52593.1 putative HTH-type transcriptional regulator YdeF [Sinorhizobium fredii USDA 257]PDT84363.1 PLP-dependent aminotransferase family protein [Sinorhizobium sp. BJ1]